MHEIMAEFYRGENMTPWNHARLQAVAALDATRGNI
jgi:hypothetical protein